jgi:hypothetical protein
MSPQPTAFPRSLVLAGIALWLLRDHRTRRREIADLEARASRRRSERQEQA